MRCLCPTIQVCFCALLFFTVFFIILCFLIYFLFAHYTIVSLTLEATVFQKSLQGSKNPDTRLYGGGGHCQCHPCLAIKTFLLPHESFSYFHAYFCSPLSFASIVFMSKYGGYYLLESGQLIGGYTIGEN